jgi:GAF domain-containing protein
MNQDPGVIESPSRLSALRRLVLLDTPAEPAFDRLTRLASRLLRAPIALMVLSDEGRQFVKSQFGLAEPWASRRELRLGDALRSGQALVTADARKLPLPQAAAVESLGWAALVAVPLIIPDGGAIGALYVADHTPRDWADHEVAALRELAESVVEIVAAHAGAAERPQVSRAARLQEGQRTFFEFLSTGAPLPITLKSLAHMVESQLVGGLCSILLLDEDGRHLRHGAAPTLPKAFAAAIDGSAIGPAAGSCGTAIYRGERVIVDDIAGDPLWDGWRELALPHNLRACWSAPIRDSEGSVLGSFAIYYHEPRIPTEAELQHVDQAAHMAAVAIERRRAEEDNERLIAQLRDAVANVKTLRGLLPICSACKKIRDDGGYWNQIESYLQAHSDVDFTHSICPDCAHRLYGELG